MITRTAACFAWLVAGHAAMGGLYWALLNVPESNVFMLGTSLLLVVSLVWSLGLVEGVGLLMWRDDGGVRTSLSTGARRAWLVVFPLIVVVGAWWITGQASRWLDANWSEIDAWIILKTGWTKAAILHTVSNYVIALVRLGVGSALGVMLFAILLRDGIGAMVSPLWLRRAFAWRLWLTLALAYVIGVIVPSQYAYWRWQPKTLPGSWFEPTFATVKLSVLFALALCAWLFVLRAAMRELERARPATASPGTSPAIVQ
ncbi:MAG: hypothetical protein WCP29_12150 [Acidobacteriota bacterium]